MSYKTKKGFMRLLSSLLTFIISMSVFGISADADGYDPKSGNILELRESSDYLVERIDASFPNAIANASNYAQYVYIQKGWSGDKLTDTSLPEALKTGGSAAETVQYIGSFTGYIPRNTLKSLQGEFVIHSDESVFTQSYSTSQLTKMGSNAPHYVAYGYTLNAVGLSDMGTAQTDSLRYFAGGLAQGLLGLARATQTLFDLMFSIIKAFNPFQFFVGVDENAIWSSEFGIVQRDSNRALSEMNMQPGLLDPIRDFFSGIFRVFLNFGLAVMIPMSILFFIAGFFLSKNYRSQAAKPIKKILVRIVFLVIGLPIIGSTYTQLLSSLGDSAAISQDYIAYTVASTFVDFESWVLKSNLAPVGEFSATYDTIDNKADTHQDMWKNIRQSALEINRLYGNLDVNSSEIMISSTGGYRYDTTMDANQKIIRRLTGEDTAQAKQETTAIVYELLKAYQSGKQITAAQYSSFVLGNLNGSSGSISNMLYLSSTPESFSASSTTPIGVLPGGKSANNVIGSTTLVANETPWKTIAEHRFTGKYNLGDTQVNFWTDGSLNSSANGDTVTFTANGARGLSTMSMYSFLTGEFSTNNVTVSYPINAASGYSIKHYYSVSLLGGSKNFIVPIVMYLNFIAMLGGYVILAFAYIFQAAVDTVLRGFDALAAALMATIGSYKAIASFISIVVSMFIQVFVSLIFYTMLVDVMFALVTLVDNICSNLASGAIELAENTNMASIDAIGEIYIVISVGMSAILTFFFVFGAISWRKAVLGSMNETIDHLVGTALGVQIKAASTGFGGVGGNANTAMKNNMLGGAAVMAGGAALLGAGVLAENSIKDNLGDTGTGGNNLDAPDDTTEGAKALSGGLVTPEMRKMDKDGDGIISNQEAGMGLNEFGSPEDKLRADGFGGSGLQDGTVTDDEIAAYNAAPYTGQGGETPLMGIHEDTPDAVRGAAESELADRNARQQQLAQAASVQVNGDNITQNSDGTITESGLDEHGREDPNASRTYDPRTGKVLSATGVDEAGNDVEKNFDPVTEKKTAETVNDAESGRPLSKKEYDPETGKLAGETEYDLNTGNKTGEKKYNPLSGALMSEAEYDPDTGQLLGGKTYTALADPRAVRAGGNPCATTLESESTFDPETGITTTQKYDKHGNEAGTERSRVSGEGDSAVLIAEEYDAEGRKIAERKTHLASGHRRETLFDENENPTDSTETYPEDEHGVIRSETRDAAKGGALLSSVELDTKNNIETETQYDPDTEDEISLSKTMTDLKTGARKEIEFEYEIDENGNKVLKSQNMTDFDADDLKVSDTSVTNNDDKTSTVVKTDTEGNIIAQAMYAGLNGEGELLSAEGIAEDGTRQVYLAEDPERGGKPTITTFDKDNKVLQVETLSADGDIRIDLASVKDGKKVTDAMVVSDVEGNIARLDVQTDAKTGLTTTSYSKINPETGVLVLHSNIAASKTGEVLEQSETEIMHDYDKRGGTRIVTTSTKDNVTHQLTQLRDAEDNLVGSVEVVTAEDGSRSSSRMVKNDDDSVTYADLANNKRTVRTVMPDGSVLTQEYTGASETIPGVLTYSSASNSEGAKSVNEVGMGALKYANQSVSVNRVPDALGVMSVVGVADEHGQFAEAFTYMTSDVGVGGDASRSIVFNPGGARGNTATIGIDNNGKVVGEFNGRTITDGAVGSFATISEMQCGAQLITMADGSKLKVENTSTGVRYTEISTAGTVDAEGNETRIETATTVDRKNGEILSEGRTGLAGSEVESANVELADRTIANRVTTNNAAGSRIAEIQKADSVMTETQLGYDSVAGTARFGNITETQGVDVLANGQRVVVNQGANFTNALGDRLNLGGTNSSQLSATTVAAQTITTVDRETQRAVIGQFDSNNQLQNGLMFDFAGTNAGVVLRGETGVTQAISGLRYRPDNGNSAAYGTYTPNLTRSNLSYLNLFSGFDGNPAPKAINLEARFGVYGGRNSGGNTDNDVRNRSIFDNDRNSRGNKSGNNDNFARGGMTPNSLSGYDDSLGGGNSVNR